MLYNIIKRKNNLYINILINYNVIIYVILILIYLY